MKTKFSYSTIYRKPGIRVDDLNFIRYGIEWDSDLGKWGYKIKEFNEMDLFKVPPIVSKLGSDQDNY